MLFNSSFVQYRNHTVENRKFNTQLQIFLTLNIFRVHIFDYIPIFSTSSDLATGASVTSLCFLNHSIYQFPPPPLANKYG